MVGLSMIIIRAALVIVEAVPLADPLIIYCVCPSGGVKDTLFLVNVALVKVSVASSVLVPLLLNLIVSVPDPPLAFDTVSK